MKKFLLLVVAMVSLALPSLASTTTVTGTIVDPNGNPYASGTIGAALNFNTGQSPTTPGGLVVLNYGPGALDASGHFSIVLTDTSTITPAGSTYQFTVCAETVNLGPSVVQVAVCFTSGQLTITGPSVDISAQLNTLAKVIGPPPPSGVGACGVAGSGPGICTPDGRSLQVSGNAVPGGPDPVFDLLEYEPHVTCPSLTTTTGSISSGSGILTVVDGSSFQKDCYVMVVGAGTATTTSVPTGVSATYTPPAINIGHATDSTPGIQRSGNTVTVTLMHDTHLLVGQAFTISGSSGCATPVNGSWTVATMPANNQITFAQAAANESCGDGTIQANAGSTTYTYRVMAIDIGAGQSAWSVGASVANSASSLSWDSQNTVIWTCPANAATFEVWETTTNRFLGTAPPCYSGNTTQSLIDFGQSESTNWPIWTPSAPSNSAGNQALITKISSINGNALQLAATAGASVTNALVVHDDTVPFKNAIAALRAASSATLQTGGGTVYVPAGTSLRFGDLDLERQAGGVGPTLYGVAHIKFDGTLFPWMSIWVRSSYFSIDGGTGTVGGAFAKAPESLIEPGGLNPVILSSTAGNIGIPISNVEITTNTTRLVGSGILLTNQSNSTLTNVGVYDDAFAVASPIVSDGCSNGGGTSAFGANYNFVQAYGSSVADFPAIDWKCTTGTVGTLSIGSRAFYVHYTSGALSGGPLFVSNWLSEGNFDRYDFKLDFTNSANVFGADFINGQDADDLFVGQVYGIWNVTAGNSGSLHVENSFVNKPLVFGQSFTSAVFSNSTGTPVVGDQTSAVILDSSPPTFYAAAPGGGTAYPAFTTRNGFIQGCSSAQSRVPPMSLFVGDCNNGVTTNTFANLHLMGVLSSNTGNPGPEFGLDTTNNGYATWDLLTRPGASGNGDRAVMVQCQSGTPTSTNCVHQVEGTTIATETSGGYSFNQGLTAAGTAAVLSGTGACATLSVQSGGSWSGKITCTGTTGASTLVITPGQTAPNGWHCGGSDTTNGHELTGAQSGVSTSTCTLKFSSVTANDVLTFSANEF